MGMPAGLEAPRVLRDRAFLPTTSELMERIGWFINLRWLAVLGVLAFVELGRRILPVDFHLPPLYATVAVLALYNGAATLQLRSLRARSDTHHLLPREGGVGLVLARWLLPRTLRELGREPALVRAVYFVNAQILLDLLLLALLIHYTGGIENPLRMFFLFHVIIAAILLSKRATYLYATVSLLLMVLVTMGEFFGWIPHYTLNAHWRPGGYLDLHLAGTQLFLLGAALFITAYMASSIAARLRQKERDVVILSGALEREAERLEVALGDIRASERAKSQYLRKVAHELRGPLGTVHTALTVALQALPTSIEGPSLELIRRAERRSLELAEMTRELLSLSRAQERRDPRHLPPLDLAVVAQRVLEEWRPRAQEAGLELRETVPEALPEVTGDEEGLGDLLSNLLGNAVRYTPRGGVVALTLRGEEGGVTVEVSDTGIGIESQALGRIFEEFFRSESARAHHQDGTGLGLAIAKAVVERHGGSMDVESRVGEGTRFTVRIPGWEEERRESNPEGVRKERME